MRDDILGLATIRMFPFEPTPPQPPFPKPVNLNPAISRFEAELNRASAARTFNAHPLQRYVSPLQQSAIRKAPRAGKQLPTSRQMTPGTSGSLPTRRPYPVLRRPGLPATEQATRPDVARPAAPPPTGPWQLAAYPHPSDDNGRGLHWVPTTGQSPAAIDRFVADAQRMGVKWVTLLNNGANIGDNDYLVNKLVSAGIEPVMRLYSPILAPLQGDITAMVKHYTALGVHYFQPFNEPNLDAENPDGTASVDRYLDAWIPAAQAIIAGGGLPGFGSMAPGGDMDDQQFLKAALQGLEVRGQDHLLDRAWLSMHNYTWNHPIQDRSDGDGFFKFRAYHQIVQNALGRDLPIIGTEGGTFAGEQEDPSMPAVTSDMAAAWTRQEFSYMRYQREPYLFASSVWTIADLAGGGADPRFEAQALFKNDGSQSVVATTLEAMT